MSRLPIVSYSDEDRHKAPASTLPFPLSLQDATQVRLPHSVVKVHQDARAASSPPNPPPLRMVEALPPFCSLHMIYYGI